MVKRSKEECIPTNISETWCKEYDLWKLLWSIKQLLPIQVKVEWIKGHQDELSNGQKVHGPFSRPVELNILMDKVATTMTHDPHIKALKRNTYSFTAIGIYQNDIMISDIEKYLYLKVNGEELKKYIQKKYYWNDIEQSLINWEAIESAMKSYTEIRKTRMTQLMFDWQNDGHQKMLFDASTQAMCPAECGEIEDHNHYLYCKDKRMSELRLQKLRSLRLRLERMESHPYIISTLMRYLKGENETTTNETSDDEKTIKYVHLAIEENLHLGQSSLEKGFTSKYWEKAQREWIKSHQGCKKYKQINWGRDLVIALQTYTFDMWKIRNEILHGNTKEEGMEKKKQQCKERITQLYKMSRKDLSLEDKKYFRMPLQFRLKMGYSGMRQWIELAEHIFQRRMNTNEKKKLSWYFPIQIRKETYRPKSTQNDYSGNSRKKEKKKIQTKLNFVQFSGQRPRGG